MYATWHQRMANDYKGFKYSARKRKVTVVSNLQD